MKIAILADRLVMGGLETHIISTVNELLKRGHQILLNTAYTNPEVLAQIDTGSESFNYRPWSDSPPDDLVWFSPDVIHVHPFTAIFRGYDLACHFQKPFVVTMHGLYDFGVDRSPLGNRVSELAQAIIAVDHGVAKVLTSSTAHPEKVRVIHNGINLSEFHPMTQKKVDESLISSLNPNWRTIVVVSRLVDGKDVPIYQLIECIHHIAYCLNGVNVLIVGDGASFDDLKKKAEAASQICPYLNLQFTGRQQDVRKYLAAADLVMACDRAAMEAMATQRAVYAMNAQGFAGVIDVLNYREILLYRSGFRKLPNEILTDDLINLLKNNQKREYYAKRGIEIVWRNFDINTVMSELETVYRSCVNVNVI